MLPERIAASEEGQEFKILQFRCLANGWIEVISIDSLGRSATLILGGGFFPPILKNMLVKLDHFLRDRGENNKYLGCHHLSIDLCDAKSWAEWDEIPFLPKNSNGFYWTWRVPIVTIEFRPPGYKPNPRHRRRLCRTQLRCTWKLKLGSQGDEMTSKMNMSLLWVVVAVFSVFVLSCNLILEY